MKEVETRKVKKRKRKKRARGRTEKELQSFDLIIDRLN